MSSETFSDSLLFLCKVLQYDKVLQFVNQTLLKAVPTTILVSSGASFNSWGEGASLTLIGHPSSNGVTIKILYKVDVLPQPASHPIFSCWAY